MNVSNLKYRKEGELPVKKNNLMLGMLAALLLTSTLAWSESKYPAADFQPKVLYQDSDYKHNKSSSTSSSSSKVDPKYPAANFEPKVLYKDSNYKPGKFSNAAASSSTAVTSSVSSNDVRNDTDYSLVLVIFALAGVLFFVYKKRTEASTPAKSTRKIKRAAPQKARRSVAAEDSGALTGVARYLRENKPELSSVSKYLESKSQQPASRVSKYVAKKVVAAKQSAAEAATGVEKYIRQRS
jgi:hypothetical protein